MNRSLRLIIDTLILVLLQVLVFNNMRLLGGGAYIYVMLLLLYPINVSEKVMMPICFLIGGLLDIFGGTYGVHMAAFTLTAFVRPWIQRAFFNENDINGDTVLTYRRQGMGFVWYALTLIFVHHVVLMMFEAFEWRLIGVALLKALASTLFTSVLILSFYILTARKKERN